MWPNSSRLSLCSWSALPRVVRERAPFGDHDDTEILAPLVAALDGVLDLREAHRELRDQDHVRSTGDARFERDPVRRAVPSPSTTMTRSCDSAVV
jgi:hypothetical protein